MSRFAANATGTRILLRVTTITVAVRRARVLRFLTVCGSSIEQQLVIARYHQKSRTVRSSDPVVAMQRASAIAMLFRKSRIVFLTDSITQTRAEYTAVRR